MNQSKAPKEPINIKARIFDVMYDGREYSAGDMTDRLISEGYAAGTISNTMNLLAIEGVVEKTGGTGRHGDPFRYRIKAGAHRPDSDPPYRRINRGRRIEDVKENKTAELPIVEAASTPTTQIVETSKAPQEDGMIIDGQFKTFEAWEKTFERLKQIYGVK